MNRFTMELARTLSLFVATALAEIVGCYLPSLWLKQGRSAWWLLLAAASLALFARLLSLHPIAAGRVDAAYGGVYIGVAILWLWAVDRITPTVTDWIGVAVSHARHGHHHVRPQGRAMTPPMVPLRTVLPC